MHIVRRAAGIVVFALIPLSLAAQSIDPAMYADLKWRHIGPFPRRPHGRRRRRAAAAERLLRRREQRRRLEDDRLRPHVDADLRRPADRSIGAVAVAPSDPNIIYAGSGEGLQRPDLSVGDGIYKSTDAGKTWEHLGLHDARADRRDHRRPARSESPVRRGARPSVRPEHGARRLPLDRRRTDVRRRCSTRTRTPARSISRSIRRIAQTVYAALWAARQGPWEYNNAYTGTTSGLFKSTDGGTTWQPLTSGLPTCRRRSGPHRHRDRAERTESDVRVGDRDARRASTDPTTRARAGRATNTRSSA